MNKTPSAMPGVSVHCGGEHDTPNATRPDIQANDAMQKRLANLLWIVSWRTAARPRAAQ